MTPLLIRPIKNLFRLLALFLLLILMTILGVYLWIEHTSRPYLYDDINRVPSCEIALVLGTAKYLTDGRHNAFYDARIEAAAQLYHAGKARYFIVSGANPSRYYNEPEQMRFDLLAAGIPPAHIQADYAGFRTLDSILRMKKVFQNQRYLIISQPFHNARAVFIARWHHHDAIAFNARDPVAFQNSMKTRIRELFARIKAVLDLLIHKQAKFYGDTIAFPQKDS